MQLEFHQRGALWARRWEHLRVRHRARQRRLMVSLAAAGQQTPIVVVAAEGQADRYVVIDGYKRIAALQQLGRDTVEAVVWPMGEAEAVLLDRSLRFSEQETALEQGRLLQELEQRFGWGLDELARRLAEPKAAAPGRAWRARSARRRGARSIAPAASSTGWPSESNRSKSMLSQGQRTAILELAARGANKRGIARALKVSRPTVRRVLRSNSAELPALDRSEKAEPYRQWILELFDNFLAGRRFAGWEDLNLQARQWCDKVNSTYKKHIRAVPRELFAVERLHLKPLPVWIPAVYRLHERMVDVEGYLSLQLVTHGRVVEPGQQRGRKVLTLALRQLLRLVREYPREPLLAPEARAVQHLLQADGGALSSPRHRDHDQPGVRGAAERPRQPSAGGSGAEPAAALLPQGAHPRAVAARSARLRPWPGWILRR